MPQLLDPPSERLAALKEYIAQAENPVEARAFVLDLLDPEADAPLLDFLAEQPSVPSFQSIP